MPKAGGHDAPDRAQPQPTSWLRVRDSAAEVSAAIAGRTAAARERSNRAPHASQVARARAGAGKQRQPRAAAKIGEAAAGKPAHACGVNELKRETKEECEKGATRARAAAATSAAVAAASPGTAGQPDRLRLPPASTDGSGTAASGLGPRDDANLLSVASMRAGSKLSGLSMLVCGSARN